MSKIIHIFLDILPYKLLFVPLHQNSQLTMARQVRYIEPIESISGDLGQKQKLYYPAANNSAWDSPQNARNAARNYKTTYVGLKRRRSGKNYFSVRKKSTFHNTAAVRLTCALMGGANSIAAALLKDLTKQAQINVLYQQYVADGGGYSRRIWVAEMVKQQLADDAVSISLTYRGTTYPMGGNPWKSSSNPIAIPDNIKTKFMAELG